ncbi:MAG: TatD family hydrolase [Lachnospiraceae bacterium]
MIFETHAHYEDEQFDEDRDALLKSLRENNIEYVVNVGSCVESCHQTVELMKRYDFIYGALGLHPTEVGGADEAAYQWLCREIHDNPKVKAVGEIGLDYYWDDVEPKIQKAWFERQIELARGEQLPIIIHSREAAKDTYEIMDAHACGEIGGVVHCFSYSVEEARKYLNMGFYLGIGGVLTFKNSRKLKEVVEYAPLDRLLLETDCPYLAPEPFRGKRNSSLYIPYVVKEMSQLKGIPEEEIIAQTYENAKKMYRI